MISQPMKTQITVLKRRCQACPRQPATQDCTQDLHADQSFPQSAGAAPPETEGPRKENGERKS